MRRARKTKSVHLPSWNTDLHGNIDSSITTRKTDIWFGKNRTRQKSAQRKSQLVARGLGRHHSGDAFAVLPQQEKQHTA